MGKDTGALGPPEDLEPIGRFQWEQALRMLALPWPTKSFGLLLATFAASDGTRIHPGEEHLARVTGLTDRSVRSHLAALRETYYLIERTERGSLSSRRDHSDVYRLVVPNDLITRVGFVPAEQTRRPAEIPSGQQERLPIGPVDNSPTTGNQLPVDNENHRKSVSGERRIPPETERTTTGNLLHDHRKSVARPPEADFRSPIQGPLQTPEQVPDRGSQLPHLQSAAEPVDNDPVDNSPPARAAADWNTVIGRVRERMAAANPANPRHARPGPDPIVRPDRE